MDSKGQTSLEFILLIIGVVVATTIIIATLVSSGSQVSKELNEINIIKETQKYT